MTTGDLEPIFKKNWQVLCPYTHAKNLTLNEPEWPWTNFQKEIDIECWPHLPSIMSYLQYAKGVDLEWPHNDLEIDIECWPHPPSIMSYLYYGIWHWMIPDDLEPIFKQIWYVYRRFCHVMCSSTIEPRHVRPGYPNRTIRFAHAVVHKASISRVCNSNSIAN